ncbi:S41 family peptidase [Jeotgalibacillus terrae]|uniref:S41 family peptidase n=1 Tax=Jeotgalibacillus terrae TaxID=587735 RepID=A0ABW5ZGE2_9BACL|nr:carboxyl-terminal processing protease [Jeotgalibacillus terrae]
MKRVLMIILCMVLGAGVYYSADRFLIKRVPEEVSVEKSKIEKAQQIIQDSYVEKVDEQVLLDGALKGMVAALGDPYSVYMDEQASKQFHQSLDSTFSGIGAEITQEEGKFLIVAPLKDSPAEEAGLKPNDVITHVDNEEIIGLTIYELTAKIRGPKGSRVQLGIERGESEKSLTINVVRDDIPVETVTHKMYERDGNKTGYIEIKTFGEGTGKDVKAALEDLEKSELAGLIVDVRGNPGGLLSSVEEVLSHFITDKKPFMYVEQRSGKREALTSATKSKKEYPVTVLIDEGSASASEILAAAMYEVEGYTLIGTTTFGKGTVQQSLELGDGSQMKLTVSKWLTPDKRWIHKKGIQPTLEVVQPDLFELSPVQSSIILKRGMNDERVSALQKLLIGLGYEVDRTDGYYSNSTEKAILAFQKKSNLKETGEVNTSTLKKLSATLEDYKKNPNHDHQLQSAIEFIARH